MASCSILSEVIGNSAVNLTTKGGEDYWYSNSGGTVFTKTGGGSKISYMGYIDATHTRDISVGSMGQGGGFQNTPVTTTDATPSNVTNDTNSPYLSGTTEMGFIPRVTLAAGVQHVEINVGAFMNAAGLPFHIKVTSPSDGVLLDTDLSGISTNTDTDKVLILSCTSDVSEDWDFDVSNKIGGVGPDGFIGVRYVHLGSLIPQEPVITVQPTNQTIVSGATASFTTTVTGATSYQWETQLPVGSSWANVSGGSGGTSDDYTTGTLTRSSDNGRHYRLKATNADGDTYSSEVTVIVTEVPTSYSGVGLVTGGSNSFTGEAMTGGPLTMSSDVEAALTGQSLTYSAGSLGKSADTSLTGSSSTISLGTVIPTLATLLTTQLSTIDTGILIPTAYKEILGQDATFATGVLLSNIEKAITGDVVTFSQGTLVYEFGGSNISIELSGISFDVSTGTFSTSSDKEISGQSITNTTGILIPAADKALSTILSVAVNGTLVPTADKEISGQSISNTVGTLIPTADTVLSGESITASQGALISQLTTSISGLILALAQGNLLAANTLALTGQLSEFSSGALSASGGDAGAVTVELTGQSAQLSAGDISSTLSRALTGLVVTLSQGNIPCEVILSIVGQAINSTIESLGKSTSVSATGLSIEAYQELLTASTTKDLSGAIATFTGGNLDYSVSLTPSGINISIDTGTLVTYTNISISGMDVNVLQNNLFLLSQILDILDIVFVRTVENRIIVKSEDTDTIVTNQDSIITVPYIQEDIVVLSED